MHPTLLIEAFDRIGDLPTQQLFDDDLQLRIALPHDFVQMRGADSRLQELVIGATRVDGLVLAHVAYE
jgi:hypothetical protein